MKVCPLTRISSPAPEICPNIPLPGISLYTERVFLHCHGHSGWQHPSGVLGVYDESGM